MVCGGLWMTRMHSLHIFLYFKKYWVLFYVLLKVLQSSNCMYTLWSCDVNNSRVCLISVFSDILLSLLGVCIWNEIQSQPVKTVCIRFNFVFILRFIRCLSLRVYCYHAPINLNQLSHNFLQYFKAEKAYFHISPSALHHPTSFPFALLADGLWWMGVLTTIFHPSELQENWREKEADYCSQTAVDFEVKLHFIVSILFLHFAKQRYSISLKNTLTVMQTSTFSLLLNKYKTLFTTVFRYEQNKTIEIKR